MKEISKSIHWEVLTADTIKDFFNENDWLDEANLRSILDLYGFPEKSITIIVEDHYIDAAYRDIYYHHWSHFHFYWPRSCKRLFLFQNEHSMQEFFDGDVADFLGTIVVRLAYSDKPDHTFGRTLLNPYKMVKKDSDGRAIQPFVYLCTAKYSCHLLGSTYTIRAFPFSNQDGVAMKCAETAIYELCDYAATSSPLYARVLPSDIQSKLKQRIPDRILPSRGLYCNDISYFLKEAGFSPLIYANIDDTDRVEDSSSFNPYIGAFITTEETLSLEDSGTILWDAQHKTDLRKWFHYYVDSRLPLLTIISPNQEVNRHAILVIGHSRMHRAIEDCAYFQLGDYPCMDSAELYEYYIVQDDNQIPYVEEKIDQFTPNGDYKLDAFIVSLERHVFLDASDAISIFDSYITREAGMISEAIQYIYDAYSHAAESTSGKTREQNEYMKHVMDVSVNNPITIRYHLANSAEYKQFRIVNGGSLSDKRFYADVPMPKSVWVAEITTYKAFELGYAFGEVVLDATASAQSKVNSVILLRNAHYGLARHPRETYDIFQVELDKQEGYNDLSPMFAIYNSFVNEEWSENMVFMEN